MPPILVTGASGLLGSQIASTARGRGYRAVSTDTKGPQHESCAWERADITNPQAIRGLAFRKGHMN